MGEQETKDADGGGSLRRGTSKIVLPQKPKWEKYERKILRGFKRRERKINWLL